MWPFKKKEPKLEHRESMWMYRYRCTNCQTMYDWHSYLCRECGCDTKIIKVIGRYEWDVDINAYEDPWMSDTWCSNKAQNVTWIEKEKENFSKTYRKTSS